MARLHWTTAAAIALASLFTVDPSAQNETITIDRDAVSRFLSTIESKPEFEGLKPADDEDPRFIFVPGILGSTLTEHSKDGGKVVLWDGGLTSAGSFEVTDATIETGPLDSISAMGGNVAVYGPALADLASRSIDSDLLSVYSYDWRVDNRQSAAGLQKWMCDNRTRLEGHKIYFLTHSMGSLVVKYWFANLRNVDCGTYEFGDNSAWMDIEEIIMLGAPLYGAPSAIAAFARGTELTEGNLFGAAIRPFDRASQQLNEHGATFPSAYQLLPIYKEDCFVGHDRAPATIYLRANDQSTSEVNSLFLTETWRTLGWPAHLPDYISADEFYSDHLPELLKSAREFLCELAQFDLGKQVKTTYFYGVLTGLSTMNALEVRRDGQTTYVQNCTAAANNCMEKGDGTVPALIAQNAFGTGDDIAMATAGTAHMDLLKSEEVAEHVARILLVNDVRAFAAWAGSSDRQFDAVVKAAAEAGVLFPSYSDFPDQAASVAKINIATMSALNIGSADVSLFALQAQDPAEVVQWTSVLSSLPDADPGVVFGNFNKAGIIAHSMGDYDDAVSYWNSAVSAAEVLPPAEIKRELGELYVLRGDALAQMSNPRAAYSDFSAAIGLGNEAGRAGLETLQYSPSDFLVGP